jgi:serine/threonine protein kinase
MLDKWAAALADGPMAREMAVPSLWKVDLRDLPKGKLLGKGGFGKVQETTWLGEKYAKKVFPKNGNESQSLMIESDILTRICHPTVVRTVCWSEDKDKDNCSLVMDLMVSDLSKFLKDVPRLSNAAVGLMLQVAEGMKYLHGRPPRGFIHRDLKSLNILVRPLADAPELKYHEGYLNAKVADFGTAKIKNLSTRYSAQPVDIGTRLWMAPEMIGNEDDIDHESEHGSLRKFPFKVDVYSFAIVCAEILTGEQPYAGSHMSRTQLVKQIRKHGLRPNLPESCPRRLAFLIQRCWEDKPDERPNFSEIWRELRYIKGLLLRGTLD